MKNIHIILFFALWVILGSCFTSYVSTKQVMGIHQGMPQQSVEKVLGRPDYRRFNGDIIKKWSVWIHSKVMGEVVLCLRL